MLLLLALLLSQTDAAAGPAGWLAETDLSAIGMGPDPAQL